MQIETPRGTFRARDGGATDGQAVLLLHGFPESSACWQHQLAALAAAGHRAVAFDQRGYSPGARPGEVRGYRMDELVLDVLAVADALGADRFDLVGHDFGGSVAWTTAGRHPHRVRTLTVASTPHPAAFAAAYKATAPAASEGSASGPSGQARPAWPGNADSTDQHERSGYMRAFRDGERGVLEAGWLADDAAVLRGLFAGLPADAVDAHLAVLREPGALVGAVDWYRAMSGKTSAATPPSAVPTLYVWSDEDPALGPAAAHATADLVTGPYRFEVLHGVGHWIPELAAEVFTAMLLRHLAG